MAETIDLTPANADYSIALQYGPDRQLINPLNPPEISAGSLIDGSTDRMQIVAVNVAGVAGIFKKPPFVLDVTLNDVFIADADSEVLAHLDKGVICTPDGRIFFDPSFASMVINAAREKGLAVSDVAYIVLNMTVVPVYRNPSGQTPAFTPKTFTITIETNGAELANERPIDNADEYPWSVHAAYTRLTPADISSITAITDD